MEAGFVALLVTLGVIIGVVVGVCVEKVRVHRTETLGTIYAYYDDRESKPSLLLEYGVPIEDIASRKQVLFDVAVIRNSSQK